MRDSKYSPKSKRNSPPRANICGNIKIKNGEPIRITRGPGGKITCTKKGPPCPNCVHT